MTKWLEIILTMYNRPGQTHLHQEFHCHRRPKLQKLPCTFSFLKLSELGFSIIDFWGQVKYKTWIKVVHVSVWVPQFFENCFQNLDKNKKDTDKISNYPHLLLFCILSFFNCDRCHFLLSLLFYWFIFMASCPLIRPSPLMLSKPFSLAFLCRPTWRCF